MFTSFDELKLALYESGTDFKDACELIDLLESCETVEEFVEVSEVICDCLEGAEDDEESNEDFEEFAMENFMDEYCNYVKDRIIAATEKKED